jgi:hypothetical protein
LALELDILYPAGGLLVVFVLDYLMPAIPPPQPPDLAKLAARQAGLRKFQGSKCSKGHGGARYSKSGQCVECVAGYNEKRI